MNKKDERIFLILAAFLGGLFLGKQSLRGNQLGDEGQSPEQDKKAANDHHEPPNYEGSEKTVINPSAIQPASNNDNHQAAERSFWKRQIRVAKWLNRITGVAALTGLGGLAILYSTLVSTDKAMQLDQRAWLGIEGIPVSAPVGGNFSAVIAVKNSGKTPAVEFRKSGEVKPLDNMPDVSLDCKNALGTAAKEIIMPQGIESIPMDGSAFGVIRDKWDEQWPGKRIYAHECYLYTDIFRQHRWLTYCGRYNDKLKAFENCETGNDTGDGDGPK
jgi:hypothetical protein